MKIGSLQNYPYCTAAHYSYTWRRFRYSRYVDGVSEFFKKSDGK